jgi:hypothetical protein
MFPWKLKERFQDQVRKLISAKFPYEGGNRRAASLFPAPKDINQHEIARTKNVRYHQLLVSLEGNQRSCCLKILSPRRKSRAAILVYRGRVLGCVYGRKDIDYQMVGHEAHTLALTEIANPGNILDAYELPEELVLASASMFHGFCMQFPEYGSLEQMYGDALEAVLRRSMPATVVVTNEVDEMISISYTYDGNLIGLFTAGEGWVEPTLANACRHSEECLEPKVRASILPTKAPLDVCALGFSLTGLGDRRVDIPKYIESYKESIKKELAATNLSELAGKTTDSVDYPHHYHRSRFIPGRFAHAISPF